MSDTSVRLVKFCTLEHYLDHHHEPLGLLAVLSTHIIPQAWKPMLTKMDDVTRVLHVTVMQGTRKMVISVWVS